MLKMLKYLSLVLILCLTTNCTSSLGIPTSLNSQKSSKSLDLCTSGIEPYAYQDGFNVGRKAMENMALTNCLLALKCDIGKTNKELCKKMMTK